MNKTILLIGGIAAVFNLLVGLIVSAYGEINLTITTVIIFLTTAILLGINGPIGLKDGFKVSLNFIIPIFALIEYLLALFMPNHIADNWCLVAILFIFAFEAIILISVRAISNKIR